jgi:hypothetical protein
MQGEGDGLCDNAGAVHIAVGILQGCRVVHGSVVVCCGLCAVLCNDDCSSLCRTEHSCEGMGSQLLHKTECVELCSHAMVAHGAHNSASLCRTMYSQYVNLFKYCDMDPQCATVAT